MEIIVIGAGQSGLATARALRNLGVSPVILEAGDQPTGSWPHYYDSLTAFSPARYSAMPGMPFPGDPDHYPTRDEVVDYLQRYAETLDVEIRTGTRVTAVEADGSGGFVVSTADDSRLTTAGVVAASGSFGNPYLPDVPGREAFTGQSLHAADYHSPKKYAGQRVIVVGAGNSAVQIGYELAEVATVTLATNHPVAFMPQLLGGKDVHYWHTTTGFDELPLEWLAQIIHTTLVMDTGDYADAFESGRVSRRSMFTAFDGDDVIWADGTREKADTVLFATGYRPNLPYLQPLGALDGAGVPKHVGGISTTHAGLVYVGLEFQRSFASNTLRGVARDAEHVAAPLAAYAVKARAAYGL
ncbi:flavin-containing monooxygenase [Microtetraspora malaysiensis]|uniref:flavin-containing monooxygenase n=1 Tax=Microtetraspora malaysiensis TaxID=161358 RepID=UPI000AFAD5FB|nr:NAD(P)-binding domain-containing protein [Microtetraspora malaysiensis]